MGGLALHGEALLKALVEVAIRVAGGRSVDEVLQIAGEGLKAVEIKLVVTQFPGGSPVFRYQSHPFTTDFGRRIAGPNPPNLGELEKAFDSPGPIFIPDLSAWLLDNLPQLARDIGSQAVSAGWGCLIQLPLRVGAKRWGVVSLASSDFEAADVPALSLFGAQLHSAIEVAETIEGLERRNKELEEIHAVATGSSPEQSGSQLLETIARATRSDSVTLHRYEPETDEFVMIGEPYNYSGPLVERWRRFKNNGMTQQLKASVAHRAQDLETGAEIIAAGFNQMATVVLKVDGRTTGFLSLSRRADQPYLQAELRTAEILGAQVSALLDRARLNAESGKLVRQLQLLYEMTSAGAVVGQVSPIIERLLGQMLDAFPVDLAAIHFVERTQLKLAGWTGRVGFLGRGPPSPEYLPIDDSTAVGRTALSRKPTHYSRANFPPTSQTLAGKFGLSHLMATPLLVGDRLVGTLSLARAADAAFTREEARLAESCAVHIAVILEHVRLYDDLKQSYDDLAHTQAELVKHERLAALGELAAVMAHEVRNPLGVIFNSLTSLKRLLKPTGDGELLLRIMGEEADRLNRIVSDLLDFARPYEALKKPIALEPILASAVDAAVGAVPNSPARVVTQFPAELPRFHVDEHLVRQAFVNLVVNALQAMPHDGTVTVRALPEERDGQLWARIDVHDEGDGISAETAERIFQPFFTTKATGTGLGLAVVKRIVDAHHGEVTVQSHPEGGTTFTVRLPGGSIAANEDDSTDDNDNEDTQPPVSVPR